MNERFYNFELFTDENNSFTVIPTFRCSVMKINDSKISEEDFNHFVDLMHQQFVDWDIIDDTERR